MKMNLKAMIMSAGVGSRLDPLTREIPKPLVPIANKPILDILFEKLVDIGIKDVICNTYYLADKIIDRYKNNNLGINFNYIKEIELSGTAGGVKKCQYFFDKNSCFVVLSADGLSNVDLLNAIKVHQNSNAIATIGIKQIPHENVCHFGVVVTDEEGFITEFQEKPSIDEAKSNYINTGIYIFDYEIFDYIPENSFCDFAKDVFPKLLKKRAINTFAVNEYWTDIGTIEQYKQCSQDLFNNECVFEHSPFKISEKGSYIVFDDDFNSTVEFIGNSTVGEKAKIGKDVIIENSVIWDNVTVADGVKIVDSIIASNSVIKRDLISEVVGPNQIIDYSLVTNS